MLTVLVLLLAASTAGSELAPVHDGGVCAGLSWIDLKPGERVFVERGPDFNVFRFEGSAGPEDHWWGVYSGGFSQVHGNSLLLVGRDGVQVHRATENGKFRGYLAEKGRLQNHFFGSVFDGTNADKHFFDRIDFGSRGQALCAKGH